MKFRLQAFALPVAVIALGCGVLVAALSTVSSGDWTSLGLSALTTLRTVKTDCGGVIISTSYYPLIVGLPAVLAAVGLAGVGLTMARWGGTTPVAGLMNPNEFAAEAGAVGEKLSGELAHVLALIRSHLGSNENYAKSLANAQSRLATLDEPKQVRVIVKLLLAENERMRIDTNNLSTKLDESRAQIESLRVRLSEAQEMGLQDPLTSIGNRRCFDKTLEKEVESAGASGTVLSLVMCDIDNFKNINDTYGHAVGDEVLKMFARFLSDSVRGSDTVARFGGEEFGLILPNTTEENAALLAERIRGQCELRRLTVRTTNERIGSITASFGVATLKRGEGLEKLLERADAKLYEAKCTGRNKVVA